MSNRSSHHKRGTARTAKRAARTEIKSHVRPPLLRRRADYNAYPDHVVQETHARVLSITESVGIEFRDERALSLWRKVGANVDGALVKIPGELLMTLIDQTPPEFTLHGRNTERNVIIGGRHTVFGPGYGAPNVIDLDWQRRPSTLEDLENFYRLTHMTPAVQVNGGVIVEPMDLPIPVRHLQMVFQGFRLTDKPVLGPVLSKEQVDDAIAMAGVLFGTEYVDEHPVYLALINSNSPRVWDSTMLIALMTYAQHGQAVLCQPFTMQGTSAPANSMAAVALCYAEALAAVALMQIIRPGTPAIVGVGGGVASMKTGGPMSGTPEGFRSTFLGAQMARYYRLPSRSIGCPSASKHPDLFAGYEAGVRALSTTLAGVNFINHASGMLDGLLTMSYAKCVADHELIDILYFTIAGDDREDADEALATIAEVAPGGHFLDSPHTRSHFPYQPQLQDYNTYEQWDEEGRLNADERGRQRAREVLNAYEEPDLDPGISKALGQFVNRRTTELGA